MSNELNTLSSNDLLKILAGLERRLGKLEGILQGQPISGVRIDSLSVNKLTGGTMTAVAYLGGGSGGGYVKIDGENNAIFVYDGVNNRIRVGKF